MKSVTLKDVAKAAGVSYATVSRALSGSPQIGSDTRERIIKLCDEMGYTTNYVARSMVMKKTDLIGLVVPSIDNQFMSELAYYAEMSARSHGYNIMLCNSGPDLKQEKTVVKLLLGRQVDMPPGGLQGDKQELRQPKRQRIQGLLIHSFLL